MYYCKDNVAIKIVINDYFHCNFVSSHVHKNIDVNLSKNIFIESQNKNILKKTLRHAMNNSD